MVREAEEFVAEDDAQRKRIKAVNNFSSYILTLKSRIVDSEGLGGKLSDEDTKAVNTAIKEGNEWIEANGQAATTEEVEEKLVEVQNILSPITSKVYSSGESGTKTIRTSMFMTSFSLRRPSGYTFFVSHFLMRFQNISVLV